MGDPPGWHQGSGRGSASWRAYAGALAPENYVDDTVEDVFAHTAHYDQPLDRPRGLAVDERMMGWAPRGGPANVYNPARPNRAEMEAIVPEDGGAAAAAAPEREEEAAATPAVAAGVAAGEAAAAAAAAAATPADARAAAMEAMEAAATPIIDRVNRRVVECKAEYDAALAAMADATRDTNMASYEREAASTGMPLNDVIDRRRRRIDEASLRYDAALEALRVAYTKHYETFYTPPDPSDDESHRLFQVKIRDHYDASMAMLAHQQRMVNLTNPNVIMDVADRKGITMEEAINELRREEAHFRREKDDVVVRAEASALKYKLATASDAEAADELERVEAMLREAYDDVERTKMIYARAAASLDKQDEIVARARKKGIPAEEYFAKQKMVVQKLGITAHEALAKAERLSKAYAFVNKTTGAGAATGTSALMTTVSGAQWITVQ